MDEPDRSSLKYLLWSNKHNLWWRPNAHGYTGDPNKAGRYSQEEALGHVAQSALHGDVSKVTCMVAFGGPVPTEPELDQVPLPASELPATPARVESARRSGYLLGRLDAARAIAAKLKQMRQDNMPAVPVRAYEVAADLALGVDPETGAMEDFQDRATLADQRRSLLFESDN